MDSRVRRSASTTRDPAAGIADLDEALAARDMRTNPGGRFPAGPSRLPTGAVTAERGRPEGSSGTGRTDGADVPPVCRAAEGALSG